VPTPVQSEVSQQIPAEPVESTNSSESVQPVKSEFVQHPKSPVNTEATSTEGSENAIPVPTEIPPVSSGPDQSPSEIDETEV
jgi:hypothetical protein